MAFPFAALIGPVSDLLGKVVDRVFPDETEAAKVKGELMVALLKDGQTYFAEASKTIRAEVMSESWITRSWRPITMLVFVAIIANNYIIAPYAAAFGFAVPTLEIPPNMWALLSVGLGGYVASRGAEKVAKIWKNKE